MRLVSDSGLVRAGCAHSELLLVFKWERVANQLGSSSLAVAGEAGPSQGNDSEKKTCRRPDPARDNAKAQIVVCRLMLSPLCCPQLAVSDPFTLSYQNIWPSSGYTEESVGNRVMRA